VFVPPSPPTVPSPNIAIAESASFRDETWRTNSKIVRTADDGHADEYLAITRSHFTGTLDGFSRTVYAKITPKTIICLASRYIGTCRTSTR